MRHSAVSTVALLLVLAAPSPAQTPAGARPPTLRATTDSTAFVPSPIPLAEIPARAQATEARLEEIRQLTPRDWAVAQIATTFQATQDTLQALIALETRPGQERSTRRSMTDLHNEWIRRMAQLRQWQKTVGARGSALSAIQSELARRDAEWALTRSEALRVRAPQGILDLIDGVREGTKAIEDTVVIRVTGVLELQSQIARTLSAVQQADDQLSQRLAFSRRNLLTLDAPPLWKGWGGAADALDLDATVRTGLARTRAEIGYFLEVYRVPIYVHLAATLLLLFAVFWFRAKLDPHTAEQPAASARRVLDHPVAGAVLLIALGALVLYPRAPMAIYDVALLLTVPAILRLSPAFLEPGLFGVATAGSALFALQRFGAALLGGSVYERAESLALSVAGAALLGWALRPGGAFRQAGSHAYARSLRAGARLAAVALSLAAISNVIGNISLAQFLTSGTIASAYLVLVVLAASRVADGALIVVTRSDVAGLSHFVTERRDALVRGGLGLIHLVAALAWLGITLWVFDLWEPAGTALGTVLGASLNLGELHLSLGTALVFLTTVWVGVLAGRTLSHLLEVDVLSRLDMPRGLPTVVARLTRYALISLGFLLALAAIGLQLTQLTIIGGALGVGIGFGLQNVVNNFVSGLILAFERPIREGDLVQLNTLTGEVRRIGFRASVIRTYDGAEVIVPNASLVSEQVVNWTLSDQQRRLSIEVGVAYGTNPERVLDLLRQVPAQYSSILKDPPPVALFKDFGESALNFELRFWIAEVGQMAVLRSDVTTAINNALVNAGIEIPFPQRDLHLRTVDGPAAARLRGSPAPPRENS